MRKRIERWLAAGAAVVAAFVAAACTDDGPMGTIGAQLSAATYPAPAGLVTAEGFSFYPYTLNDFEAEDQDPINLVFTGNVDPRQIRAALLALPDGDRTGFGFPNAFPFNCTWKDAFGGDDQVTFAADQWTGSVIQLECGDYIPGRFHLRLFPAGDHTVGNAHFEVFIPGTTTHQVLTWELAEQLVTVDFVRTGIAAPTGVAGGINAAPYFRVIEEQVYDGLPPGLQALAWTIDDDTHGMTTDGNATVFAIFGTATPVAGTWERSQVFQWNLGPYPKPFCATADVPYVHIGGSVTLWQADALTESGEYTRDFKAEGALDITPIDLSTGQPDFSRTYKAIIRQHQLASFWEGMLALSVQIRQSEIPPGGGLERGRMTSMLQLGPNGKTSFSSSETCSP
jgi:hypothetical protein